MVNLAVEVRVRVRVHTVREDTVHCCRNAALPLAGRLPKIDVGDLSATDCDAGDVPSNLSHHDQSLDTAPPRAASHAT